MVILITFLIIVHCLGWCPIMTPDWGSYLQRSPSNDQQIDSSPQPHSLALQERGEGFVLTAKHGALLCGQKDMARVP